MACCDIRGVAERSGARRAGAACGRVWRTGMLRGTPTSRPHEGPPLPSPAWSEEEWNEYLLVDRPARAQAGTARVPTVFPGGPSRYRWSAQLGLARLRCAGTCGVGLQLDSKEPFPIGERSTRCTFITSCPGPGRGPRLGALRAVVIVLTLHSQRRTEILARLILSGQGQGWALVVIILISPPTAYAEVD